MGNHKCPKCGIAKPLTEEHWPKNASTARGLGYWCRLCTNADFTARRKANAAKNRAKNRISEPNAMLSVDRDAVVAEHLDELLSMVRPGNVAPTVKDVRPIEEFEITIEEPAEPEVTTLEFAYQQRQQTLEKRDTKKQRDALLDENERLKRRISELVELQQPPDALVYRQPAWERSDAIPSAIASDWHIEETVDGAAVHGINEYNLEVARQRAQRFFQNFLRLADIQARDSKVTTINLDILGDIFSGHIHDELKSSTSLTPGKAAHFAAGLFASGIEYLLKESSYVITGDCIPGNHGRMTEQVWLSDPTGTSLETYMYHSIAARFADNPRVRMTVANHAMVYRSYFERFTVRKLHGYEIKFGGGVGGITIPIRKKLAAWDKGRPASLTIMGHFHQRMDGGDFIVNGSLIGFNTYAQAIGASPEEAQQAFYLIAARNGGQKSVVAPVWVTETKRAL